MDDIISTGDDYEKFLNLKKLFAMEFEIKPKGSRNSNVFPRNEVARSKEGIVISQRQYMNNLTEDHLHIQFVWSTNI